MKFVKIYPAIISALLLSSVACEQGSPEIEIDKPDNSSIDPRLTCSWKANSAVDSIFTNYTSEVRQIGDSIFILRASGINKVHTGYLGACNFPREAMKDGLSIKVSGYLVTYPGIGGDDIFANPFEITSYELLK